MRTELQWTAGWSRPNPATLRASLSGRCRKPVLGVRAGSGQSLFFNHVMPNERKFTTQTTWLWMEVSGPRPGSQRRAGLFSSVSGSGPVCITVCLCLCVSRKLPVLPKCCLCWTVTDSFSVCVAGRNSGPVSSLEPKMIVVGTLPCFWPSSVHSA